MNAKSKAYNPKIGSQMSPTKKLKKIAMEVSARLDEEVHIYHFQKKKVGISKELKDTYNRKFNVYRGKASQNQWSDREGLLARPLGADVFLEHERGPDTLHAPPILLRRLIAF